MILARTRPPPTPGAMMNSHTQHRSSVVTLSEAKGLSRWAERCFAQHDSIDPEY